MKKLYPYQKSKRRFYFLQFLLVFGFIFSANGQKVPNVLQKSSNNKSTTAINIKKTIESATLILQQSGTLSTNNLPDDSLLIDILIPLPETSCSSSDLHLVEAILTEGDLCNTCDTSTPITRTLTLAINNTTGSTSTSFAFLGTLEIYNGLDGLLISSTIRTGCDGLVPPNAITSLDFGPITYNCGWYTKNYQLIFSMDILWNQ